MGIKGYDVCDVNMTDAEKDAVIRSVYNRRGGTGGVYNTFKDAKAKIPSITHEYVKEWYKFWYERTRQEGKGKNSFVAPRAYHEYQFDIFYITESQMRGQKYKLGLSCIDIFSKYATVIPLNSRNHVDVMNGIYKAFREMGKQPEIVMTDPESSLFKKEIVEEFDKIGVQHIITQASAHFVERFHRTFRGMLHKMLMTRKERLGTRVRFREKENPNPNVDPQWYTYISKILYLYNKKNVHSATGMTPDEARRPHNESSAKASMELRAKMGRKYPEIEVGDTVRVIRKKTLVDKEHVGNFREGAWEVTSISVNFGQKFYKIGDRREYIRSDLVLIKKNGE